MLKYIICIFFFFSPIYASVVNPGIDNLLENEKYKNLLTNKRIGLVSHIAAINKQGTPSYTLLKNANLSLTCLISLEHNFFGNIKNGEHSEKTIQTVIDDIPVYSLYASWCYKTLPKDVLKQIDVLIFDVQDIGCRSYSFINSLYLCLQIAKDSNIPIIVLDRPNPMGGIVIDGPAVEPSLLNKHKINVPYCHGMTFGELATLFNKENNIQAQLTVIPMQGWKRNMSFKDTQLSWVPTSPQIPCYDSAICYSITGLIGHCSITSIGVGYTTPFRVIGAPWINNKDFLTELKKHETPGINFIPYMFSPSVGKFEKDNCNGIFIVVNDITTFLPVSTQFIIMGVLKNLYPKEFDKALETLSNNKINLNSFLSFSGYHQIFSTLKNDRFIIWKILKIIKEDREKFIPIKQKYIIYN